MQRLPFGEFRLRGEVLNLMVAVTMPELSERHYRVTFPYGYRSEMAIKSSGLIGDINLSQSDGSPAVISRGDPSLRDISINLYHFPINSPSIRNVATAEEREQLKGIGKKLLCFALTHFKKSEPINPDATLSINLYTLVDNLDENPLEHQTLDQLIMRIWNKPMEQREMIDSFLTSRSDGFPNAESYITAFRRHVASRIFEHEHLEGYVTYFEKAFGFQRVEPKGTLQTLYETAMNLCNVCTDQVDPITMEPLVEPTIRIDAGDGLKHCFNEDSFRAYLLSELRARNLPIRDPLDRHHIPVLELTPIFDRLGIPWDNFNQ